MKKTYKFIAIAAATLVVACATNPFSGKSTLALVPDSQIFPMAFQEYNQFLSENKVVTGTPDANSVQSVGIKIKNAAEKWLNANGHKDYLNGYQWEYKLIQSKELNAWCMPGGKIAFYTGIMPVCKDDAGIATVMGHEVAHALANHGQQRMSAAQLQQIGGGVLDAATSGKSETTRAIYAQAYGIGSQYGAMMPFNRSNEAEADKIGLILMALAGYNPDESIAFWQRMSAANTSAAPPEFLSTHPSDATRIANLKKLIPEAKAEAAKFGIVYK